MINQVLYQRIQYYHNIKTRIKIPLKRISSRPHRETQGAILREIVHINQTAEQRGNIQVIMQICSTKVVGRQRMASLWVLLNSTTHLAHQRKRRIRDEWLFFEKFENF